MRVLDRLEITAIVDNQIETWTNPKREDVQRFFQWVKKDITDNEEFMVAGGGLSLLINATIGNETSTVLFDAAESPISISTNVEFLGLDMSEIKEVVLSHGHWDHFGGLLWSLKKIGKKNVPVYIHPRMQLQKGYHLQTNFGEEMRESAPFPSEKEIVESGGKMHSYEESFTLAKDMLLRTGEIPRTIEQHTTKQLTKIDGEWTQDQFIIEDVSLAAVVDGKGLVVIVGCSHAGILNIIREAVRLTGEDRIYAIIGGFHLAPNEDRHEQTVLSIRDLKPRILIPCHCTGWKARHLMSREIPEAYVEGSVGNKYIIYMRHNLKYKRINSVCLR